MIPVLQALPIDWSAESPDNRTKGEVHDLTPQYGLPYRVVVLEKGYFYLNNLFIIDQRGRELQEDIDYQCLLMEPTVAKKRGLTACAVIVVTNPDVGNLLFIDAQMVGGIYCSLNRAILEQAANVILGANRNIFWRNVKNKPSSFRPNGHLHALWELFGFTPQTAILNRMTTAIAKMSKLEFDNLYGEFNINFDRVKADLADIEARLTTHIEDHFNPHKLTKLQVKLEYVFNGAPASLTQAQTASGTVMNAYATPLRAKQSIDANFTPGLEAHVFDTNNPHNDTAAKLGTMTVIEMQSLANKYYNRGDTVSWTSGLGGRPYEQFYTDVRSNVPAMNITTGMMDWTLYADSAPIPGYMAVPSASGTLTWRKIAEIFDIYEKKGNAVLYAGVQGYYTSPTTIGAIVGTNHPDGTICAVRYNTVYGASTGNGGIYTYLSTLGMAVIKNGVWGAPGWG